MGSCDTCVVGQQLACDCLQSHFNRPAYGLHTFPNGWFGADQIYLSGNQTALRALLNEMNSWDAVEQENMIAHWAGHKKRAELTKHLTETYGWQPRYRLED
jgi:hypothetical protein